MTLANSNEHRSDFKKLTNSILYYCPCSKGGIADYAQRQIQALTELDIKVVLVCPQAFVDRYHSLVNCQIFPILLESPIPKLPRYLDTGFTILKNIQLLCMALYKSQLKHVLLATYAEYLAPLWAWQLRRLKNQDIWFGAIVHDPVRHFQVGPRWWHYWSIAEAYSFLDVAFVHAPIELDTKKCFPSLKTSVIPCGSFEGFQENRSRQQTRLDLGIPLMATVLLAFGHLRDEKNLDLVLQALISFPDIHLIIAGKAQTTHQKPISFYSKLADQLGLSQQCHFIENYLTNSEVGNLFVASDHIILTYGKNYYSASSVLNIAVSHRKTCLASSGVSNLKYVVQKYNLGVWVEPDSLQSIQDGIEQLLSFSALPQWSQYEQENSWGVNASRVIEELT